MPPVSTLPSAVRPLVRQATGLHLIGDLYGCLCDSRLMLDAAYLENFCKERVAAAELTGVENADEIRMHHGKPEFLSNHAGGILGGISTGQDIVVRLAVKPTSSILTPVETITRAGEATEIVTKGRHDPCVGIRGAPVVEAMMALVLADQKLLHRAQCGVS